VDAVREAGGADVALFHCVSNYPADPADCNLRAMETLHAATGCPVGWSDHTTGIDVAIAAVALGAALVEKHFTLDRGLPGPDQRASLLPKELADMVTAIRHTEAALGDGRKVRRPSEDPIAALARRSLCYRAPLRAGTCLEAAHLVALRPGTGLDPGRAGELVGRRLARDVRQGELVGLEDFDVAK
jgi:sialic acid synthase SpsE